MQGKEGGWVVEEASHAVKCWLNVTCNVLIVKNQFIFTFMIYNIFLLHPQFRLAAAACVHFYVY